MAQRTLAILKPDATEKNLIGEVLGRIENDGLKVIALKSLRLSGPQAESFYEEHEGKPFFDGLVAFMTSGTVVPVVVEGENAINRLRTLMGATDPDEAAPGTIRAEFAGGMPDNIIHGSDAPESARREIHFFFSDAETIVE